MKTLILPARYTPDSIALSGAAVEAGWQVERLPSWRPPSHLRLSAAAIYGEPLFGAVVAAELSLVLLEPPLGWLAGLPREYLSREVTFTTLDIAKRCRGHAFIKPADDKCFPAAVYPNGSAIPGDALPDTVPVIIAEPVPWDVEFRFFILNRLAAAFSPYIRRGAPMQAGDSATEATPEETHAAVEFCGRLLTDSVIPIPPAVVIDVGRIDGRGWAVVEANAAWASGIYGCDAGRVLEVIARACRRREDVGSEERLWVVERNL